MLPGLRPRPSLLLSPPSLISPNDMALHASCELRKPKCVCSALTPFVIFTLIHAAAYKTSHLPESHPKFYISSRRLRLRPKPISLSSPRLNKHSPVAQDKIVACFLSHPISSSGENPVWLELETLCRIQPLPLLRQLLSQAQHQSDLHWHGRGLSPCFHALPPTVHCPHSSQGEG